MKKNFWFKVDGLNSEWSSCSYNLDMDLLQHAVTSNADIYHSAYILAKDKTEWANCFLARMLPKLCNKAISIAEDEYEKIISVNEKIGYQGELKAIFSVQVSLDLETEKITVEKIEP